MTSHLTSGREENRIAIGMHTFEVVGDGERAVFGEHAVERGGARAALQPEHHWRLRCVLLT